MATLYFDLHWHKWHTINVVIAANYLSEAGKEFEAWLLDDYYEGSGYALRMNKILEFETLGFHEIMTRANSYTDIVMTQKLKIRFWPMGADILRRI
jgi:hypothetical protein